MRSLSYELPQKNLIDNFYFVVVLKKNSVKFFLVLSLFVEIFLLI